jgi:hypothetical protein
MEIRRRITRIASIFVLAFLCLNVGGVLCLSYCFEPSESVSVNDDAHLSEHCRLAKQLAEESSDSSWVETHEMSCCALPVVIFAAPVEKQTKFSLVFDEPLSTTAFFEMPRFSTFAIGSAGIPVYRPPPLDRRVERQLNCVIRI